MEGTGGKSTQAAEPSSKREKVDQTEVVEAHVKAEV
jgi:hypothetical protein